MLMLTPTGGWHHILGEGMIISGIVGMVIVTVHTPLRKAASVMICMA